MTTFTCTYEELKKIAAEFLKAIPTLDEAELDNGLKCFNLHYLGAQYNNRAEEATSIILVEYVNKKALERDLDLALKNL